LFTWRRLVAQGGLTAVGSGEEVVPMIRDRLARQSRRGLRDLGRIAGGYSHTRRGLIASAGLGALAMLW
jgi:hypothetical protein